MGVIALLQASFFPPVAVAVLGLVYFVLRPSSRGEVVSSDLNARSKEAAEDDEAGKKGKKGKKADPRDADRDVKKQLEKAIDAKRRGEQFKAAWLFEQGRLWVKAAATGDVQVECRFVK